MSVRDVIAAAAGSAGTSKTYIEDVFSTYLYTGNGSTQTINNGIDLAGKGGMVWIKPRANSDRGHFLFDTSRGVYNYLQSNSTAASTGFAGYGLTAFNSNGFNVTDASSGISGVNGAPGGMYSGTGAIYTSWTFRKAPKFFDVVTYTGNSTDGRAIFHNLGQAPGMVIVKSTGTDPYAPSWWVWHRSLGQNAYLQLNATSASGTSSFIWTVNPTASNFYVDSSFTNANNQSYVAYLFAHDTTTDGLIQCGSYTGNGSASGPEINLGWEPQYVMIKNASGSGYNWQIFDKMRGMLNGSSGSALQANLTSAESSGNYISPTATGFNIPSALYEVNYPGATYIYMAIRSGPMRTPTDATKVFKPYAGTWSNGTQITTGFPVDLAIIKSSRNLGSDNWWYDRLRGTSRYVASNSNSAELESTYIGFDTNDGVKSLYSLSNSPVMWSFRRAPGFFDVVCYNGTSVVGQAVPHSLGVAPELMVVKCRNTATTDWQVYCKYLGTMPKRLVLNSTNGVSTSDHFYTDPTATNFYTNNYQTIGTSGQTYVAYLFASCPGVSKVGTMTLNGTDQNVDCGFTNGARFVMSKRTDAIGNWLIWDTARGIVDAADPILYLNTNGAEVTSNDYIDPYPGGFKMTAAAGSGTFLYLAIA